MSHICDAEVASMLLISIPGKFDSITMPTEQFKDLNKIILKDLIGTLNVNEDKLKRHSI